MVLRRLASRSRQVCNGMLVDPTKKSIEGVLGGCGLKRAAVAAHARALALDSGSLRSPQAHLPHLLKRISTALCNEVWDSSSDEVWDFSRIRKV